MKAAFKKIMNIVPRPLLIQGSYIVRPFIVWYMRGTRFVDPIDNQGYKNLLPYGYENQRDNVLSPGTYSLERHRLMWLYLKNETDFFTKSAKVLHIAPEQSFIKRFRNLKHLNYTTSDLESPLADVKADICDLPFEDNSYDVIFCNHVLEHIPDDAKAMSELFRVMKPGGWGILQVPISYQRDVTYEDPTITSKEDRRREFGQYDHVRVYGMDYYKRLENAGFIVEQVDYTKQIPAEDVEKYCLEKGEILPVVRKPL
ncbi:methyltransferase domain-containing protein [Faecalibacter sp. WQ 117]|uniref:Methyltransferase domain-containing protein n=2 Tax=Faecalibacter rhinopitheci TaxID=2779678 RepID=A0A8J7FUV4_9FLAO|nr:methyltransferase domain-containing protein [Faecalibacter rhinopitheci]MBQ0147728.1 methyltransferase domain-containing protein [Candidatus Onthonaster equi]